MQAKDVTKKVGSIKFNGRPVAVYVLMGKEPKLRISYKGKFLPIGEAFASVPKGVSRQVRKLLASQGHTKMARTKRISTKPKLVSEES
jgi:hypothetical protein